MHLKSIATFFLLPSVCFGSAPFVRRDYSAREYYALHLSKSVVPSEIGRLLGVQYEGPIGELPDHYTFSSPRHRSEQTDQILQGLRKRRSKRDISRKTDALDSVLWSQKQKLRAPWPKRVPPAYDESWSRRSDEEQDDPAAVAKGEDIARTLEIKDPMFREQWHLFNRREIGHDINVTGVWLQGITGHNQTVAIVDDGLDMYSDDLKGNYFAEGSYDFNEHTDEPKPRLRDDNHGTRCAGEVAAVRNEVCGLGIAYDSKIAGIRILSKAITDEDEAAAMNYGYQKNNIYSCSWGPPDDGASMEAPGILIKRAMVNAVQNGRGGKGTIYVFAAGNGAASGDNCNFDGYTNSIYSITVGAIDRKELHPYYSEKCSAQLAVTYSSGSGDAIHTTNVGKDSCTSSHGGTSAAAPIGAGIFALVLEARPELGWRDVQWLTVMTSVQVHTEDPDWQTTGVGKPFSHTYAFGKLDTFALVEAAKTWEIVKPQAWYKSPWLHIKKDIPQGNTGLVSTFTVTADMLKKANLEKLEHVTVTMNVEHGRRGDVSVDLRSPSGVVSHLSTTRSNDNSKDGYQDWTFMSVAHWGESGIGEWTVIVKDTEVNEHTGTFVDWRFKLWGICIDPSKQKLLPLPTEHDDDDHDRIVTAGVATASVDVSGAPADTVAVPTDHPNRPVNAKPTGQTTSEETQSGNSTLSEEPIESFYPSYVGSRTQIWIYVSIGLIVLFCAGLGTYYYIQRRKRLLSHPRDDYEFAMLPDNEDESGGVEKRHKRTRGGELYDAFAGESDEDVFSDLDEADEDRYDDNGRLLNEKDVGAS